MVLKTPPKKKAEERKEAAISNDMSYSWSSLRKIITCKYDVGRIEEPRRNARYERVVCHASSLCSVKEDLVEKKTEDSCKNDGNQRIVTRAKVAKGSLQVRRWSACSECRVVNMMVEPMPMASLCICPHCSLSFRNPAALEEHQSFKHAVSELQEEDSARNVVEIIFKTSWLRMDEPMYRIQRILKVHNTQSTLERFEEYREMVKAKAKATMNSNPNARCKVDGNELLRFYCTSIECSLGINGSTNLCTLLSCETCNIIKNGFSRTASIENEQVFGGVHTTASSGAAHDWMTYSWRKKKNTHTLESCSGGRAMLVCRVIAGRVHNSQQQNYYSSPHQIQGLENAKGWVGQCQNQKQEPVVLVHGGLDSFVRNCHAQSESESAGIGTINNTTCRSRFSLVDEIMLCNHRAVLPCFVVIYS